MKTEKVKEKSTKKRKQRDEDHRGQVGPKGWGEQA
jgi:hypothetical protein